MLNKIANLINYFRVVRHSLYREFEFFHDQPPKKIEDVQNYKLKSEIVNEILKFYEKCNFFYENLNINQELKIGERWQNSLSTNNKKQIDTILNKNVDEIMILHEGMFYNCLVTGFIAYSYFQDVKFNYSAILNFLRDLDVYKIMFKNFDDLPSNNQISMWGYKQKNNKINFSCISKEFQKHLILNTLKLLNKKKKYNIIEIGSGFGALAERLFEEDKINNLILLDIPSSLTTAFYYLSSRFGLDKVKILKSPSDIQKYYDLGEEKKILLIPTCYYDFVKNIKNIDLLCNFASFSEMNFDTIKFYLENLPREVKLIISTNNNAPLFSHGHHDVMSDDFPIPKYFDLIFSTIRLPFYQNWNYKTCVWLKK